MCPSVNKSTRKLLLFMKFRFTYVVLIQMTEFSEARVNGKMCKRPLNTLTKLSFYCKSKAYSTISFIVVRLFQSYTFFDSYPCKASLTNKSHAY